MEGTGTGIGIGIGNALGEIGDAIAARRERQRAEREKQADTYHQQAHDYAVNRLFPALQSKGYRFDGKTRQILYDKTGQPVQDVDPGVQSAVNDYLGIFDKYKALFPPNEPNAMVNHFRKWLGAQPGVAKTNPRAEEITPETVMGEVPATSNKSLEEINSIRQQVHSLGLPPDQEATAFNEAMRKHLGLQTAASGEWTPTKLAPFEVSNDPNRKPGVYRQVERTVNGKTQTATERMPGVPLSEAETKKKAPIVKSNSATGGIETIEDPDTHVLYHAGNIDSAPADYRKLWYGVKKEQADQAKKKAEDEERKDKKLEDREIRREAFADKELDKREKFSEEQQARGAQLKEQTQADEAANLAKTDDSLSQTRLKNLNAINSQGLIISWVRAQVAGAGRVNNTEIEQGLKAGSYPERIQRAWTMAITGKLPTDFAKEVAQDIHASYAAKKKTADEIRGSGGSGGSSNKEVNFSDLPK